MEELKKGRDEPDASKAATLGVDIIDEYNVDKYNPQVGVELEASDNVLLDQGSGVEAAWDDFQEYIWNPQQS